MGYTQFLLISKNSAPRLIHRLNSTKKGDSTPEGTFCVRTWMKKRRGFNGHQGKDDEVPKYVDSKELFMWKMMLVRKLLGESRAIQEVFFGSNGNRSEVCL